MVPRSKLFKVELPDVDFYMEFNFSYKKFEETMAGTEFMKIFLYKAYFEMYKRIQDRFWFQHGPGKKKWKRLSATTVRAKRGIGRSYLRPYKTGIGTYGKPSAFYVNPKLMGRGLGRALYYKGDLQRSIEKRITRDSVMWFTRVPYAKYHQWGASYITTPKQSFWLWHNLFGQKGHPFAKRHINIPARPFMGFADADINYLRTMMVKELKKAEKLGTYIP